MTDIHVDQNPYKRPFVIKIIQLRPELYSPCYFQPTSCNMR